MPCYWFSALTIMIKISICLSILAQNERTRCAMVWKHGRQMPHIIISITEKAFSPHIVFFCIYKWLFFFILHYIWCYSLEPVLPLSQSSGIVVETEDAEGWAGANEGIQTQISIGRGKQKHASKVLALQPNSITTPGSRRRRNDKLMKTAISDQLIRCMLFCILFSN